MNYRPASSSSFCAVFGYVAEECGKAAYRWALYGKY